MDYLLERLSEAVRARPAPPEVHAMALVAMTEMWRNFPEDLRLEMPMTLRLLCEATDGLIKKIEAEMTEGRRSDG